MFYFTKGSGNIVYNGAAMLREITSSSTMLILTLAFQSSNCESGISTPDHTSSGSCTSHCAVGPCSPVGSGNPSELAAPMNMASYLHINRILKHAHFQSLHNRGRLKDT